MELGRGSFVAHILGTLCFDSKTFFVYTRSTFNCIVDLLLKPGGWILEVILQYLPYYIIDVGKRAKILRRMNFELYRVRYEHASWLSWDGIIR